MHRKAGVRVDLTSIKTVLVVKPSSLGDVVHALPAVNLMKRQYPQLEIRWVVASAWAPLLEGHPALSGLVIFPRDECRGVAGLWRFGGWLRGLRGLRPDLALDFQGLLRSGLMCRASGARRIAGMSDAREGAGVFFDETVVVREGVHAVERYFDLVEGQGVRRDGEEAEYRLPEGEKPAGADLPEKFILLHPYSRGEGKTFTAEQVARFCEVAAPAPVVVAGVSAGGRADQLPANGIDLTNQTSLLELLWLLRGARFTVSVDSGPMHLAAAVGKRLLGVHTWTDPRKVGPYEKESWVWKAGEIRQVRELAEEDGSLLEDRARKVSGIGGEDVEAMAAFAAREMDQPREG